MDDIDEKILSEMQNDFPLKPRPYDIIAERLGIGVDELWARIANLIDSGVIRRIGASIDSRKLGFVTTLAAIRVAGGAIEQAAAVIEKYPQITHCYLRSDPFNIWFTIIASDQAAIERIIEEIREALSLDSSDILDLPSGQIFKLDARFNSKK